MLGDSMIAMGEWGDDVANEGVGGETVSEIRARVPDIVDRYPPGPVYIIAGINSIAEGVDVWDIYTEYVGMVEELQAEGFSVRVISTLYLAECGTWTDGINNSVKTLNALLESATPGFIDVTGELCPGGYLSPLYDNGDGTHINEDGYKCIISALRQSDSSYYATYRTGGSVGRYWGDLVRAVRWW
jgi:lysophospholipase L1-like esterase